MGEIKRYTLGASCLGYDVAGRLMFYEDHLADKTAALAAQAEGHRGALEGKDRYIEVLQAETEDMLHKHEDKITRQHNSWARMTEDLKSQHAQELAEARGEGEPALLTVNDVNQFGWNSADGEAPRHNAAVVMAQLNQIGQILIDIREGRKDA